jgi:hypothetical protein
VCSKPVHGEVYSIQRYVIKFVCELQKVGGFLRVLHQKKANRKRTSKDSHSTFHRKD